LLKKIIVDTARVANAAPTAAPIESALRYAQAKKKLQKRMKKSGHEGRQRSLLHLLAEDYFI